MIDYVHAANVHSVEGPRAALNVLFPLLQPASILDVGCGQGTWIKAANELGITDVVGIDGIALPPETLLFSPGNFRQIGRLAANSIWSYALKSLSISMKNSRRHL